MKLKKSLLLFFIFLVLPTIIVEATTTPRIRGPAPERGSSQGFQINIENPLKGDGNLFTLAKTIIQELILPLGSVIVILAFIYSGFLYVKAQGNDKEIEKAHRALLYSAVGAAVLLGALVIMEVVKSTVNEILIK